MSERTVSGELCRRVLEMIEGFYAAHGYLPTYVQTAAALDVSTGPVGIAVRTLWRDGSLKRIRISEQRYIYVLPKQVGK